MYLWRLVGHDTSEGTLRSGIGADLAPTMRLVEDYLTNTKGFFGHICEVVPRLSVFDLDAVHVATGREWLSFRDRNGGVRWEARSRPVDADVAYDLPGSQPESADPGAIAS